MYEMLLMKGWAPEKVVVGLVTKVCIGDLMNVYFIKAYPTESLR